MSGKRSAGPLSVANGAARKSSRVGSRSSQQQQMIFTVLPPPHTLPEFPTVQLVLVRPGRFAAQLLLGCACHACAYVSVF